jgi:VWFA-related protein
MPRLLLIVLIGAATIAQPQDPPFTLRVDVAMVTLDVAVFNAVGEPVGGLGKLDFVINEDGRPQQIETFTSSDAPYNTLLVIDRSGSMTSAFPLLIEAVNRFISNLRVQDRFALSAFDNSVKRLIAWRSVRSGPRKTVNLESGGDTDFYGALHWAARELGRVRGRKAALFYTDGEDRRLFDPDVDAKAFRQALDVVRQTKASFHFVGLGAEPDRGGNHLRRLAEETGGHVYFPESMAEIVPLYDQISRELGISYTLSYLSSRPVHDGTYRAIEVSVPGADYRVSQSRTGYRAN